MGPVLRREEAHGFASVGLFLFCQPPVSGGGRCGVERPPRSREDGPAAQCWFAVKGSRGCGPVRILFVEPDRTLRGVLLSWLRDTMPAYTFLEAGTQRQAARVAACASPRVVVVDIARPGADGKETVRSLKRAAPGAAVVALTMSDDAAYCEELKAAGASDCILIWEMHVKLPPAIEALVAAGGAHGEHKAGVDCSGQSSGVR